MSTNCRTKRYRAFIAAETCLQQDLNNKLSDDNFSAVEDTAELMPWHQRFNHLSFRKLKMLAMLGILPRRLANARIPWCAWCVFGSMTRQNWRTKKQPKKLRKATAPDQIVSVDQMQLGSPGFIAQMKGKLTTSRYVHAMVFVDHLSRLRYIHLQRTASSEETLEAKRAFEAFVWRERAITVQAIYQHRRSTTA